MSELDLFCTNCFSSIEGNTTGYCENCGQSLNTFYTPDFQLPVNASLNNGRYSVSNVLNVGDFDISYLGYDFQLQSQVVIKEVFYRGVSQRDSSDGVNTTGFKSFFFSSSLRSVFLPEQQQPASCVSACAAQVQT